MMYRPYLHRAKYIFLLGRMIVLAYSRDGEPLTRVTEFQLVVTRPTRCSQISGIFSLQEI